MSNSRVRLAMIGGGQGSFIGAVHGARESCEFVRSIDFQPSGRAFDAAFEE